LLDKPCDDVVVGAPGPEERGERHVDDDQRGGDEGDLPAEQTETAVDIPGEDPKEIVDDAGAAHGSLFLVRGCAVGRCAAEEAVAGLGPDRETLGVADSGLT